jgi:CheY-like chemotaxis protein
VALIALVLSRDASQRARKLEQERTPERPPLPQLEALPEGYIPPKELVAAWVQFLRDEAADAANGLNNRLNAIRSAAASFEREKLTVEQIQNLDHIETEVGRAMAITTSLLHRVHSVAPDSVPPAVEVLQEKQLRPADILVVEDDASNREVITRMMQRLGHRVTPVANGLEAFEVLQLGPVDCVVCDIQMPNLGGKGLYEQIEKEMPQLASRFVFVTGDYTRPETREFLVNTGCPVVAKPYEVEALLGAIAVTLERAGVISLDKVASG